MKLPKQLTGFQLKGWKWGDKVAFGKYGTIVISQLTEKKAKALIQQGFPYLEKKKKPVVIAPKVEMQEQEIEPVNPK